MYINSQNYLLLYVLLGFTPEVVMWTEAQSKSFQMTLKQLFHSCKVGGADGQWSDYVCSVYSTMYEFVMQSGKTPHISFCFGSVVATKIMKQCPNTGLIKNNFHTKMYIAMPLLNLLILNLVFYQSVGIKQNFIGIPLHEANSVSSSQRALHSVPRSASPLVHTPELLVCRNNLQDLPRKRED